MSDVKKKPKPNTTTLFVREVPTALKNQFKAYCARRGVTLRAALVALMDKAVRNEEHLNIPRSPE